MAPPDVPPALVRYLELWNERDLDQLPSRCELTVGQDCLWVDPLNSHIGRAAFEENVRTFRATYPTAVLSLASAVDGHHDRYRYHWVVEVDGVELLQGFDVATLDEDGLVARVDGFFGPLERT